MNIALKEPNTKCSDVGSLKSALRSRLSEFGSLARLKITMIRPANAKPFCPPKLNSSKQSHDEARRNSVRRRFMCRCRSWIADPGPLEPDFSEVRLQTNGYISLLTTVQRLQRASCAAGCATAPAASTARVTAPLIRWVSRYVDTPGIVGARMGGAADDERVPSP